MLSKRKWTPPRRNSQGHVLPPSQQGPLRGRLRIRPGDTEQIAEAMRHAAHARQAALDPSRRPDGTEEQWNELGLYYENLAREASGLQPLDPPVSLVAF